MLLPVCWWFVTAIKGIGSDSVQFPVPVAIGLTIGILVQMAVLAYAVQGWWRILTAPIWLLLLMDLLILWFWNVRVW